MTEVVETSLATPRLAGAVLAVFALLALVSPRSASSASSPSWSASAARRSG